METSKRTVGGVELTVHSVKTIIIGAGAAGLNAAEHLHELGHEDFAIVTDSTGGASADPASAKSAYYRMGMWWDRPDSPTAFADTLAEGGMTHGDLAYVEAVNSIPEFLHLVRNGVPFPRDKYGRYVANGEKNRLASAGPQTSALMAETSLRRVKQNKAKIFNRHQVVALLVDSEDENRTVVGALAVDLLKTSNPAEALVVFNCRNIIMATGGPQALFKHSLYPTNCPCSHAIALKAGAAASNLTETRFGLALTKTRKPLRGNYQFVIPCYYSGSQGGRDRKAFLADYFHATKQIASAIFLKGKHWAFSAPQLQNMGPSLIDIAVYNETAAGRRVFVDFSQNVKGEKIGQFNISQLEPEAREFLEKNTAQEFTPFDRLHRLDPEKIDTLIDHGTDLREPQEITICAEDTFGGLSVNIWWETTVPHLFAVGDLACTHGNPPEGAELNAGQVGGLRAAEYIANNYDQAPRPVDSFMVAAQPELEAEIANMQRYVYGPIEAPSVKAVRNEIQNRTSSCGAMIRSVKALTEATQQARNLYDSLKTDGQQLSRANQFVAAVNNELLCLAQIAFFETIKRCIELGGGSRGAYLILDEHGDANVLSKRGSELRHRNENMGLRNHTLETTLIEDTQFEVRAAPLRPVPEGMLRLQTPAAP